MTETHFASIQYGFAWGPMEVERLAHIEGRGFVIEVRTPHKRMQIYVSEGGRVVRSEAVRDTVAP